jgi:2-methylfumaryl-CoA isomerase
MATFVAGPSAGLSLAQLGADVVRIDPIGGAVDFNRWPLDASGRSLYWPSLNRNKRSVSLDLRSEQGRALVVRMICGAGANRGVFIDNQVGQDWLAWEALTAVRRDLIHVHIEGYRGGRPAVDYTVNAEVGVPMITGPEGYGQPVNHVLPAWDLLCGQAAATALLAALRRRDQTGEGARIDLSLADTALAGVANLGWLSEASLAGVERRQIGNSLYGSYAREFATSDARYVMVVALTAHQWRSLVTVTETGDAIAALEREQTVDFVADESARYHHRKELDALFAPWFATRDLDAVSAALTAGRVLWSAYRSLAEAAAALDGPLRELEQPGIGTVISAQSPLRFADFTDELRPASALGADTVATLADLASADEAEISTLVAAGVIGSADA